ncbi:unnamed protein product [Diamesa hyperborea]
MKVLKCILVLVIYVILSVDAHRFGYSQGEQRLWKKKHESCRGQHQSPISINSRRSIPTHIPAIEFIYYHNLLPGPLKIHNNGHSVSLLISKPVNFTKFPYIFGGKLKHEYELVGLHFHWGDKNNRGAEHVLNDIRYPLEMHIIHINRKYSTVQEALTHKDGLTVLAFFYQIKETEGTEIHNIAKHLTQLDGASDKMETLQYTFTLSSLIGNINTERYYTYRGSLTTPSCAEAVTWVIFPDTLPISLGQMSKFRQLSNGIEGLLLVDNFRNIQPIGNRKVFLRSTSQRHTKLENLSTKEYSKDYSDEEDVSDWYYN